MNKGNNMNISVCIIVKNEQNNIEHCLKCLTPYMPEIIVVDTGSTDNTKAIASQYTDKVYDFPWINDFAAAKNFAISKVTNPYVMVLDSDEFIESLDVEKLQEELQKHPDQVGRIFRRNVFERNGTRKENTEWINRIFSKELFYYEGCIHEQVTAINGEAYKTYQASVVILHTGYDLPERERKQKAERNIILLRQELQRLLIAFLQKADLFDDVNKTFVPVESEYDEK